MSVISGETSEFGAVSIRILRRFRLCLLKEAESYSYRSREIVGCDDKIVIQQMSHSKNFRNSVYNLKISFQGF
jgi:hypothetical protein